MSDDNTPTEAELTAAAVVSSDPSTGSSMSQGDVNRALMDPEELEEREERADDVSDAMRHAQEVKDSGINPTLMYSRINTAHDGGGMGTLSRMNPITFADEVAAKLTPANMTDPSPEAEATEPTEEVLAQPVYGDINDQQQSMTPEDKIYRSDPQGGAEYALRETVKSPNTDASQVGALHSIDGGLDERSTELLTNDGISDEGALDDPDESEGVDPDSVTNPWGGTPAQDTTSPVVNSGTIQQAKDGDAEPDDEAQAQADEQIEENLHSTDGGSATSIADRSDDETEADTTSEAVDVNIVNDDPIPVTTETEEAPVDASTKANEDLVDEDYGSVTAAQLKTRLDDAGRFTDYTTATSKGELWTLVTGLTHNG